MNEEKKDDRIIPIPKIVSNSLISGVQGKNITNTLTGWKTVKKKQFENKNSTEKVEIS